MKKSEFLNLIYEILEEKETNTAIECYNALNDGDYKEVTNIGNYLTILHEGMNFIWNLCKKTLSEEENNTKEGEQSPS